MVTTMNCPKSILEKWLAIDCTRQSDLLSCIVGCVLSDLENAHWMHPSSSRFNDVFSPCVSNSKSSSFSMSTLVVVKPVPIFTNQTDGTIGLKKIVMHLTHHSHPNSTYTKWMEFRLWFFEWRQFKGTFIHGAKVLPPMIFSHFSWVTTLMAEHFRLDPLVVHEICHIAVEN